MAVEPAETDSGKLTMQELLLGAVNADVRFSCVSVSVPPLRSYVQESRNGGVGHFL